MGLVKKWRQERFRNAYYRRDYAAMEKYAASAPRELRNFALNLAADKGQAAVVSALLEHHFYKSNDLFVALKFAGDNGHRATYRAIHDVYDKQQDLWKPLMPEPDGVRLVARHMVRKRKPRP